MLEQHFESARRWVDFIHRSNPNLLWQKNRGGECNDWLNADTVEMPGNPGTGAIPPEVFATAFFANSTKIVAKMADVLGRKTDAAQYGKLFEEIKVAFNRAYVTTDGQVKGDTQSGYALALHFDLLDEAVRPKATEHLLDAIKRCNNHPSTGIQASHRMMLELSRNGRHDEACRLINLRTLPSWGFMVEMGATTIWEKWDVYVKGRGFSHPSLCSANHVAFGSVAEWVWRELAGINADEQQPGYKHFLIRPRPGGGVTWVKARYDSIRGPIVSNWEIANGKFSFHVEIPVNTTATVCIPAVDVSTIIEGDNPAAKSPGVEFLRFADGAAWYRIGSGRYLFKN